MGLTRSTSEAGLGGITTADAKTHMRITHNDDDAYIGSLILAATKLVEVKTNRQLITATWVKTMDDWPEDDKVILPYPPLSAVTTVKYYDTSGVQQTLSASVYRVITDVAPGYVTTARNQSWPSVYTDYPEAIEITYSCGYGTTASVPGTLSHAIKLIVSHLYEHRESVEITYASQIQELPMAVDALCSAFKVPRLG